MAQEKNQANMKNANARIIDKAFPSPPEKIDLLHLIYFLI